MIIDTDVLVWHLRGNKKARDIIHKNIPFSISVITYIELVQGMRDKKEMNGLMKQLSRWNVDIIQINEDISTRAMIYIEQYFHNSSMQMADALIAATCVNNSDILLAGNEKHYKSIQNIQMKKFMPT